MSPSFSAPVRSMTGFGSVRFETANGEIAVSLRSVNHRSLDLHFHGGSEFAAFENEIRELLKRHLRRGHVEVRLAWLPGASDAGPFVNRAVLEGYLRALQKVAKDFDLPYQPDVVELFGLRGVITDSAVAGVPENILPELLTALENCLCLLNAHREREGDQLRSEMLKQVEVITDGASEVRSLRAEALPHFQVRLREKLRELLAGSDVSEARLAEEAALLADRSDIEEEIVRLDLHTRELQELLRGGGEVGKRLDFLLQEMNRETNTLLAKSAGAGTPGLRITTLGLAMKASIERIREQGLNLE